MAANQSIEYFGSQHSQFGLTSPYVTSKLSLLGWLVAQQGHVLEESLDNLPVVFKP
jgi:hypothetical protein